MTTATVTLFDDSGYPQSTGTVIIVDSHVRLSTWLWGATHAGRRPIALVRRIVAKWLSDGADQSYIGWDHKSQSTYSIGPSSAL